MTAAARRRIAPHKAIAAAFVAFLVGEAFLLDVQASRGLVVALSAGLGAVFVFQRRAPLLVALDVGATLVQGPPSGPASQLARLLGLDREQQDLLG